jgi:hypothetical protein
MFVTNGDAIVTGGVDISLWAAMASGGVVMIAKM